MAVAKRQRKGKSHEIGTKENLQTRVKPHVKQIAFPASLVCTEQARGEETELIKKGSQEDSLPLSFVVGHRHTSSVLSFVCQIM